MLMLDYFIQSHYLHVLTVKVNDQAEHLGIMKKSVVQMCHASEWAYMLFYIIIYKKSKL